MQELEPEALPDVSPEEMVQEQTFTEIDDDQHSGQTFEGDFEIEKYDPIEASSLLFDKDKNEVVDLSKVRPIDIILAASKEKNIRIKPIEFREDGSYDTGCRRPDCMGRGYVGFEKNYPVPCQCLFYPEDIRESRKYIQKNRKVSRKYDKLMRERAKAWKEMCIRNRNLKQIDSNVFIDQKKRKWKWVEMGNQNSRFERILK